MIAEALLFLALPALLLAAAAWDLASYTIPNWLQFALLAGFAVFALAAGLAPNEMGNHLIAGVAGLAAGFTLFAFGYIGGGDAKLFACMAAWFGLHDLMDYALAASLFGGALTLALLTMRRLPLPATLAGQAWILRLHDERAGIPYGVALAAGGLAILPYTDVFRTAVG